MFLLVFLIYQVTSEWVEISQNHYRKEPLRKVTIRDEEYHPSRNRIFLNYSITDRPWNNAVVTRIPNLGNVRRVQLPSKTSERSNQMKESIGIISHSTLTSAKPYENIDYETRVKHKIDENWESKHKVTHNINPGVASTSLEIQSVLGDHIKTNSKFQHINTSNYHKRKKVDTVTSTSERNLNIENIKQIKLTKSPYAAMENFLKDNKIDPNNINNKNNEIDKINTKSNKTSIKAESNLSNLPSYNFRHNDLVGLNDNTRRRDGNPTSAVIQENSKSNEHEAEKYDHGHDQSFERRHLVNNTKTNSINVIWKFMKVISDNISRNTRRSFRSKIRYLEDLQNIILANIENRVEQAWPDDAEVRRKRSKRAARGHVEFPSSEGALMTISFLTFAVFLIKLVLQVIHTYKNKTMMLTPTVVAAVGRAAAALNEQISLN